MRTGSARRPMANGPGRGPTTRAVAAQQTSACAPAGPPSRRTRLVRTRGWRPHGRGASERPSPLPWRSSTPRRRTRRGITRGARRERSAVRPLDASSRLPASSPSRRRFRGRWTRRDRQDGSGSRRPCWPGGASTSKPHELRVLAATRSGWGAGGGPAAREPARVRPAAAGTSWPWRRAEPVRHDPAGLADAWHPRVTRRRCGCAACTHVPAADAAGMAALAADVSAGRCDGRRHGVRWRSATRGGMAWTTPTRRPFRLDGVRRGAGPPRRGHPGALAGTRASVTAYDGYYLTRPRSEGQSRRGVRVLAGGTHHCGRPPRRATTSRSRAAGGALALAWERPASGTGASRWRAAVHAQDVAGAGRPDRAPSAGTPWCSLLAGAYGGTSRTVIPHAPPPTFTAVAEPMTMPRVRGSMKATFRRLAAVLALPPPRVGRAVPRLPDGGATASPAASLGLRVGVRVGFREVARTRGAARTTVVGARGDNFRTPWAWRSCPTLGAGLRRDTASFKRIDTAARSRVGKVPASSAARRAARHRGRGDFATKPEVSLLTARTTTASSGCRTPDRRLAPTVLVPDPEGQDPQRAAIFGPRDALRGHGTPTAALAPDTASLNGKILRMTRPERCPRQPVPGFRRLETQPQRPAGLRHAKRCGTRVRKDVRQLNTSDPARTTAAHRRWRRRWTAHQPRPHLATDDASPRPGVRRRRAVDAALQGRTAVGDRATDALNEEGNPELHPGQLVPGEYGHSFAAPWAKGTTGSL